jgi:acylphosphatase
MMRVTAIAKGKVQGVGYRYFVTDCAVETRVTGFVRNLPDGSVLIVAEGEDDSLETFLSMIRAEHDPIIRVDSLDITKSGPTGEFRGFTIRW